MSKKTFLKELEAKLNNMSEAKREKIIKRYEKLIDDEIEAGKEEKDVIKSFGDIDLLAKLLNDDDFKKEDAETDGNSVSNAINKFIDCIDNLFKNIDDKLAKRILEVLCFVFIAVLAISLIQIPFKIIDVIGSGALSYTTDDYHFFDFMRSSWSFVISVCFIVLVVWLLSIYISKIANHYPRHKSRTKTEATEEVKSETVTKRDSDSPFEVVFVILKVFVILITLPLILLEAGLFMGLVFISALLISGVAVLGPLMIIIGLMTMIGVLIDLVFTSIFKGGKM